MDVSYEIADGMSGLEDEYESLSGDEASEENENEDEDCIME